MGKTNAKWSPVATAWYRMMPEVVLLQEVEDERAKKLVKTCPVNVFDIEDVGKGLQDILSISCAKDLLLNLQKSCGYQRLNPNELRAVMEVLHFVTDESTEAHTSQTSNWGSEVIVPDDGCRLVHASSCLYIDSFGSRYIKYIDTSTLKFVHQDIPERINTFLGIRKLSDVVVEVLEIDSKNVKALYRRAQAYINLVDLDLAEFDIKKALEIDPANRDVKLEYKVLKEKVKEINKKGAQFYGNMFAKLNKLEPFDT